MNVCAKFADLDFKVECSDIVLSFRGIVPVEVKGPGELWQDDKGSLQFKVYLTTEGHEALTQHIHKARVAGQLLGDEDFIELVAYDFTGQVWSAQSVFPNLPFFGLNGGLATGTLNQLCQRIKLPDTASKTQVAVRFLGKIRFPANKSTKTETHVGEYMAGSSVSLNVAMLEAREHQFSIYLEGDHTVVAALVPSGMDEMTVVANIQAALQFVTGNELTPLTVEATIGDNEILTLLSARTTGPKGAIYPPIKAQAVDFDGHFWRLFSDYFLYVANYAAEDRHPVSNFISMTIESSVASMEAGLLALGVGVEGVASHTLVINGATPSAELIEELDRIDEAVSTVKMSEATRNRLKGTLSGLRRIRVTDLLKAFVTNHSLAEGSYAAWSKLRNTMFHGSSLGGDNVEMTLQRRGIVITLLYSLVFEAIGYYGPFINYGVKGWPQSNWPMSALSNEPVTSMASIS